MKNNIETISIFELDKIEKRVLNICDKLDYLDPECPIDYSVIVQLKGELQDYISKLTPGPKLHLVKA